MLVTADVCQPWNSINLFMGEKAPVAEPGQTKNLSSIWKVLHS